MFVDTDNLNYKYVVSNSDNYLVLSKVSSVNGSWNNPITIDTLVQYLEPSFLSYKTQRSITSEQYYPQIDVSDSFFSRADCNTILLSQFILILGFLFVLNGFTRFVRKGGVFFGS